MPRFFYDLDLHRNAEGTGTHAGDSMRLFIVPGMGHCIGENSCDPFAKVGTVLKWLDSGKAPDQILYLKLDDNGKVVRALFALTRRLLRTSERRHG